MLRPSLLGTHTWDSGGIVPDAHAQALRMIPAAVGCNDACSVTKCLPCHCHFLLQLFICDSGLLTACWFEQNRSHMLRTCALPCFKTLSWLLLSMQPSHELQNVDEVLTLVSKHPHGVMAGQIKDAYKGVSEDVKVWFVHLTYCGVSISFIKLVLKTRHPLGSGV